MLSINTNIPSLIAQSSLKVSTNKLNTAIERMTTGFKINGAKDNAANYSITTNMSTKIGAYQVAEESAAMGLDFITTASDSLDLIADKLERLRALSEQAANGTYGEQSIKAINAEASAIVDEIQRLYNTTEYNGKKVFGEVPLGPLASKVKDGGFLEEVVQRDASAMTKTSTLADGATVTSGTYSISTAEELLKFHSLKVNGAEFVLANDIDMSGIEWGYNGNDFTGTFDGNGHVISNLSGRDGLFHFTENSVIKNIGLENIQISNSGFSPLIYDARRTDVSNCYVTGSVKNFESFVFGGLVGELVYGTMTNCYADINISNCSAVVGGGLVGSLGYSAIQNCFASGYVSNNIQGNIGLNASAVAGLVGWGYESSITDCEVYTDIGGDVPYKALIANNRFAQGGDIGEITVSNCTYNPMLNAGLPLFYGDMNKITSSGVEPLVIDTQIYLQIGINSGSSSGISFDSAFSLSGLNTLRFLSAATLEVVDKLLEQVNSKSVEYGAIQNRLESALEEISTQYENLVSSRSTLQDADIADVSSEYIKQQILQQASATLLATANQSPALALQLL